MTLMPNDYQKGINKAFEISSKEIDALKAENKKLNEQLRLQSVSNHRELLFAFIKKIRDEFKDENWDYLDFIAERVLSK